MDLSKMTEMQYRGVYRASKKKLLMINVEKIKNRESFTRDRYFCEGRKIHCGSDKAIWKN